MEPKKSKYDTNPLDPDFVKNAEAGRDNSGPETQEVKGATREIGCLIPRKLNFAKEARAQYGGQFSLVRIGIEKPERGGNTAQ